MDSDDDDLYDPAEAVPVNDQSHGEGTRGEVNMEDVDDGEEEGEEVEEDDSDDVCFSERIQVLASADGLHRMILTSLPTKRRKPSWNLHRETRSVPPSIPNTENPLLGRPKDSLRLLHHP